MKRPNSDSCLNGTDFEGRNIVVSEARPQQQRAPRPMVEEAGHHAAIATELALQHFLQLFLAQDP